MCYTNFMASASDSAAIQYQTVDDAMDTTLPQENSSGETQEEILVSPTPRPTITTKPIQYNFFNMRVLGVLVGIAFLWVYIKGLHKK